jgi:hypothetical protein
MAFVGYERLAGGGAPNERPVEAITQQLEDDYVFFSLSIIFSVNFFHPLLKYMLPLYYSI